MRLIVLDTNVVVSAGIKRGNAPSKIVEEWILEERVQVVTSPWVIGEYREVARRKKFRRYGFPPMWLELLIAESLQLAEPPAWPYSVPDPNDAPFLALASAAGAWLVTGNLRDFPEGGRVGVTVVSPSEYLRVLETSK